MLVRSAIDTMTSEFVNVVFVSLVFKDFPVSREEGEGRFPYVSLKPCVFSNWGTKPML